MLQARIAERLRQGRFVVLGRAGMDLYADPPGAALDHALRFVPALGGSAGNIAAGLARLGVAVDLVSAVSDDAVGRFVLAQLADYGIGSAHVAVLGEGRRTSLAVTESRVEGLQGVIYRNHAADLGLTCEAIDGIDFADVAALVVTGTALAAEPSRGAALHALERARAAGAVCVFDVDYRAYGWAGEAEARDICAKAAGLCDLTVGNDVEFGLLAGGYAAGRGYAARLPAAVYKMGAAGSESFVAGQSFRTGIYPVQAMKPLGSGDGFLAGLLAALAEGAPLDRAVRQGSAVAAMVVAGFGCAPAMPDRAALRHFMTERIDAYIPL